MADPGAYWTIARKRGAAALSARPNPGHYALAAMEEAGHVAALVTQNTDGLHRDAGSSRVIELHGTGRVVQCLDCGAREPRSDVQDRLDSEMPPRCLLCRGGFLKPMAVLFGEPMPLDAVSEALASARDADLMLVVGTSLVVYPAAEVPLSAVEAGAPMVIVNAEPTPFDALAEVVIRGRSGEVLPRLLELAEPLAGG
jgi:NAD-dependent deacetylase